MDLAHLETLCSRFAADYDWTLTSLEAESIAVEAVASIDPGANISYQSGSNRFPDIIVNSSLGIEVKCTQKGRTILGNSVLQEDPGVSELLSVWFLLDERKVHICPYADLISSVKVDHNPRFLLSLDKSQRIEQIYGETANDLVRYFKLPIKERHAILRDHLSTRSDIEDWKWFMGKPDDELTLQIFGLFEKAKKEWRRVGRERLVIYVFLEKMDVLAAGRSVRWHRLYPDIYMRFKAIGPLKDCLTAGGIQDGLPAILFRFKNSLEKVEADLASKSAAFRKTWKANAKKFCELQWDSATSRKKSGYSHSSYKSLLQRVESA